MKPQDLKDVNDKIRRMIRKHLKANNETLTEFCRRAGLHQSQMWVYMNSKDPNKGMHTATLEKIGNALSRSNWRA